MNAASSAPPPTSPPSGEHARMPRTLGRYTLFELIGKGGMAEIYLARAETELGATRLAVVKQILASFADDPRFSEMLIHEAKLAARLSHKHIVQVFDLGRTGGPDDQLFIAMEYVEGFDLNGLLRKCSQHHAGLPAEHALGIVADVLHGLDYAHRRADEDGAPLGIVHRDVSPSNVLISYEGEVKLCDFGIAHANDLVRESAGDALKGKAGYMSPEHARGEPIDARADVFAAAIILWELLSGRRLYRPRSEVPLLEQARRAEIPAVPDKGLPDHDRLAKIVERALAVDRDGRYASAGAFLRDLEAYAADAGLLASRLELGKWMASTFGTDIVEQRRASERRLPRSVAPPRPSERVRAGDAATSSAVVPAAPRVPSVARVATAPGAAASLASPLPPPGRSLADDLAMTPPPAPSNVPGEVRLAPEPGSLAGAALDVSDSSRDAVDAVASGAPSDDDVDRGGDDMDDRSGRRAALTTRRRVSLSVGAAVLALAALVAVARHLVH